MSPVVTKIMANLTKISQQYQGMEKAHKIRAYVLECTNKLRAKKRDDLVVELNQALHNRLEYAKQQSAKSKLKVKGYLRGANQSHNQADDSVEWEGGDTPSHPPVRERRLPFREDTD